MTEAEPADFHLQLRQGVNFDEGENLSGSTVQGHANAWLFISRWRESAALRANHNLKMSTGHFLNYFTALIPDPSNHA
jgi:hypothetical protein